MGEASKIDLFYRDFGERRVDGTSSALHLAQPRRPYGYSGWRRLIWLESFDGEQLRVANGVFIY